MKVRYTLQARRDLDGIFTYLTAYLPISMSMPRRRRTRSRVWSSVGLLGSRIFHSWRLATVEYTSWRSCDIPTRFITRSNGNEIWILHIRDSRRRPWEPGGYLITW